MEIVFVLSIGTLVFVYAMYGPIMMVLKKLSDQTNKDTAFEMEDLPSISLIVPAYNEEHWIEEKIRNSTQLIYPEDKLEIIIVTDGSTDNTPTIASTFVEEIILVHEEGRNGKIKAMERAAEKASNEILVFTDANTTLNDDALIHIADSFTNARVGMVAGEKKVIAKIEGESASGEGLYWRYESWLKKLDSDAGSVIGAAGELFAIRSHLFDSLPGDTILDDFMLSSRVIEAGYNVAYQPKAYAMEYGSASYKEEWKRKVRICAGGIQSVVRSAALFNIKRFGIKSFSFTVHRASRWTLAPMALLLSYLCSALLINTSVLYAAFFSLGTIALAITMFAVQSNKKNLPKPLLLVVYFTFMHLSAIAGWFRYLGNNQSVNWERSARLG